MKINKYIWIGAILGGLYALIPSLMIFYEVLNPGDSFRAIFSNLLFPKWDYSGAGWPFLFPLFWLVGITYVILAMISFLIPLWEFYETFDVGVTIITLSINILLWIIIGAFTGLLIKQLRKENEN